MKKWTVEGADRNTGDMRVLVVTALTADEAERQASGRGLLVANVHDSNATDVDVRVAVTAAAKRSAVPAYDDIVSGSGTLSGLAAVVRVLGILSIIGAGVVVLIGLGNAKGPDPVVALGGGLALVGYGIVMLVVAAILKLLGALSLAVRDIARNSFRGSP